MSNAHTVYPRHLDMVQTARLRAALASAAAAVLFAILLISFEPFSINERIDTEPAGPNPLNQIGYSALCMVAVFALATLADFRRLAAVADPAWLLIVGCLVFSALMTGDPATAMRSVTFTLFVAITAVAVLALPHSLPRLSNTIAFAILLVLALSYYGIVFTPGMAVHGAGGVEAQHEGLWHGVFTHKNVAGPVMATFLFFAIYLIRQRRLWSGALIGALALLFVIQTGSKTTLGLIPVAIGVVLAGRLLASRWIPVALALLAVAGAATVTVGAAVSPAIFESISSFNSDPTYTGRTTLWAFALENIAARPWTGYGFDNFWLKPIVTDAFLPIDADWDYRAIVNGHNNYLDLALFMGIPAAVVVILILCVRPLIDFARCRPFVENRRLADCFMMILIFILLNSMLESSWSRRADPTWIMMVVAIMGLRLTSRLDLRQR